MREVCFEGVILTSSQQRKIAGIVLRSCLMTWRALSRPTHPSLIMALWKNRVAAMIAACTHETGAPRIGGECMFQGAMGSDGAGLTS